MKVKIIFITFLILLSVLLFLSQNSSPSKISSSQLNNLTLKNQNQRLTIEGEIKDIKYQNNRISLHIQNILPEFVIFSNKLLNIKKSDRIQIEGKIDFYKNNPQIIISKITSS
jgi:hypothetical protein